MGPWGQAPVHDDPSTTNSRAAPEPDGIPEVLDRGLPSAALSILIGSRGLIEFSHTRGKPP